ncbi:MAG: DUF814 domain-containing protein [Candidatus Diapherotrites archaeon]|uniref:DUF814 domain-containing protein n=1 Tax=Candidatus Iainarchaeum sp. TaxID=3101447 RepID=A0A939CAK8_9ARCH|nr:DUF814 domain-containing protein [Candidatus Diapherotrites archaeon]
MEVEIDLRKSVEENASEYFEKSKKAKRKLEGLLNAIKETEQRAEKMQERQEKKKLSRKKQFQWFHAFHWFRSSSGLLVVGGKSAKSNESLVKKHLEKGDLFLHADIQGGSATVIKSAGKEIPRQDLREAAEFSAVHSKAWQQGLVAVDVYAVNEGQVSKKAKSGEALGTGSFMIYGKRQWFRKTPLVFAVGLLKEGQSFCIIAGPPTAVKKHCTLSFEIVRGKQKRSDAAKKLLRLFEAKSGKNAISLEEVIAALPGESLGIKERF